MLMQPRSKGLTRKLLRRASRSLHADHRDGNTLGFRPASACSCRSTTAAMALATVTMTATSFPLSEAIPTAAEAQTHSETGTPPGAAEELEPGHVFISAYTQGGKPH